MIIYSLNRERPLDSNSVIRDISKLLQQTPKETLQQSVLIIKIQKITDYPSNSPLLNITYKEHTDNE